MKQTTFLKMLFSIALLFSVCVVANAQDALVASGANASGGGGAANYTVGQTIQETITGSNGTVFQGIQFFFQTETLTIIDFKTNLDVTTYPNPTSSVLNMKFQGDLSEGLKYELYNLLGQSMLNGRIANSTTEIDLSRLPSAVYLLKISNQNNINFKIFKIIKN